MEVQVPIDLQNALSEQPSAMEAWRRLSPQDQQAHVDSVESAPDPMARERYLRQLVGELAVQVPGRG